VPISSLAETHPPIPQTSHSPGSRPISMRSLSAPSSHTSIGNQESERRRFSQISHSPQTHGSDPHNARDETRSCPPDLARSCGSTSGLETFACLQTLPNDWTELQSMMVPRTGGVSSGPAEGQRGLRKGGQTCEYYDSRKENSSLLERNMCYTPL
jgi:hypothetical protein